MEQNNQANQTTNNPIQYQQQPPYNKQPMKPLVMPQIAKTKSKFLTFCCAFVPGAGQMYHGLMKKGISIMVIFWGVIALSVLLYIPAIAFLFPIVWFYSFFDTVNRMNMPIDEIRMIKDESLLGFDLSKNKAVIDMLKKGHIWIGWALTIGGLYAMFNLLMGRFSHDIFYAYLDERAYEMMRAILNTVPALIVPIICIIIGVKLISSSNKKGSGSVNSTPKED